MNSIGLILLKEQTRRGLFREALILSTGWSMFLRNLPTTFAFFFSTLAPSAPALSTFIQRQREP